MAYGEYACDHVYAVASVDHVVDGDTVDVVLDLGFDILHRCRVRLLGIDTPESRTRKKNEKVYGLLAKGELCKALELGKVELRCQASNSRGKFGRVLGELWVYENGEARNINRRLCEDGYAAPYEGQNKIEIHEAHMLNREALASRGVHAYLPDD